jgi:hypothetical protein
MGGRQAARRQIAKLTDAASSDIERHLEEGRAYDKGKADGIALAVRVLKASWYGNTILDEDLTASAGLNDLTTTLRGAGLEEAHYARALATAQETIDKQAAIIAEQRQELQQEIQQLREKLAEVGHQNWMSGKVSSSPLPPVDTALQKQMQQAIQSELNNATKAEDDKAAALLKEALKIVTGARRQAYGTPEDNFQCIADLWNVYLARRRMTTAGSRELCPDGPATPYLMTPADVSVMMVLMKTARLAETPNHHDSAVDIAGYAACLARCQS